MIRKLRNLAVGSLMALNSVFAGLETVVDVENPYATIVHIREIHQSEEINRDVIKTLQGNISPERQEFARRSLMSKGYIAVENLDFAQSQSFDKVAIEGHHEKKRISPFVSRTEAEQVFKTSLQKAYVIIYGKNPEENKKDFETFKSQNTVLGKSGILYSFVSKSPLYNVDVSMEEHPEALTKFGRYELREDIVVKNLSKILAQGDDVILFFGANHDFENNIREYNKANPNRQLALEVYTSPLTEKSLKMYGLE